MFKLSDHFHRYNQFDPLVPVWCVTPATGRTIHRFFDTSPFSPSGRYMALFRLPFENRNPLPGEKGAVVLVDLQNGDESILTETCGWEPQLGSNVQWGKNDSELYYNDVDITTWKPYGVKMNPFTGNKQKLNCCVFMVSPDGRLVATTCPVRARRTQLGYGVVIPDTLVPLNLSPAVDDGLFISDTQTGQCHLLASIKEIVEDARPGLDLKQYADGEFYGFQCKWNPQGTRLLIVIRWVSHHGLPRKNHVFTMKSDGSDIRLAIPAEEWAKGGHHINWCPDGASLSMNLNIDGDGLRFIKVRYDGSGLHKILDQAYGSGHPTIHPNGRFILTDAYTNDSVAYPDGTVPIRLINIQTGMEHEIVRIKTQIPYSDSSLRVDPHPAWDYHYHWIAFNGFAENTRKVYIADLTKLLDS